MIVHLAKSPTAARLTTWCGYADARESKAERAVVANLQVAHGPQVRAVVAHSGDPIVVSGAWTCPGCTRVMRETVRTLGRLLEGVPVEAPPRPMGCGDNGCPASWPGGLGTNGGCRCSLPELRQSCAAWRKYALALEAGRAAAAKGGSS